MFDDFNLQKFRISSTHFIELLINFFITCWESLLIIYREEFNDSFDFRSCFLNTTLIIYPHSLPTCGQKPQPEVRISTVNKSGNKQPK